MQMCLISFTPLGKLGRPLNQGRIFTLKKGVQAEGVQLHVACNTEASLHARQYLRLKMCFSVSSIVMLASLQGLLKGPSQLTLREGGK